MCVEEFAAKLSGEREIETERVRVKVVLLLY